MATPTSSDDGLDRPESPFILTGNTSSMNPKVDDDQNDGVANDSVTENAPYLVEEDIQTSQGAGERESLVPTTTTSRSWKLTTFLRLFLLIISFFLFLSFLLTLRAALGSEYDYSNLKWATIITGISAFWNLSYVIIRFLIWLWARRGWRLVRVEEDRSLVDIREEGQVEEGNFRWRVAGAMVDVIVGLAVLIVSIWLNTTNWGYWYWYDVRSELVVCGQICGPVQIILGVMIAWPKVRDSRAAWVKLVYEPEEDDIPDSNLVNVNTASVPIQAMDPATATDPSPPTSTRKYISPLSIALRALTLIASLSLVIIFSCQPYWYPYRDYSMRHLIFLIVINLLIIIVYFRSRHQPKPSHLLIFVLKKEDIERRRTVKRSMFGGKGEFLTDRGKEVLKRCLLVWDVFAFIFMCWDIWNWSFIYRPVMVFGMYLMEVILLFLLFMLAVDAKWKKIVTITMKVVSMTRTPSNTEASAIPPPQVYRDVENEAGDQENRRREDVGEVADLI